MVQEIRRGGRIEIGALPQPQGAKPPVSQHHVEQGALRHGGGSPLQGAPQQQKLA